MDFGKLKGEKMSTTEHAPGPWCTKELMVYAENGNGETLATVKYASDAEFIVRACNNFEQLLERLKEATDLLIGASAWLEASNQEPIGAGLRKWVAEKGEAAIVAAEAQR